MYFHAQVGLQKILGQLLQKCFDSAQNAVNNQVLCITVYKKDAHFHSRALFKHYLLHLDNIFEAITLNSFAAPLVHENTSLSICMDSFNGMTSSIIATM